MYGPFPPSIESTVAADVGLWQVQQVQNFTVKDGGDRTKVSRVLLSYPGTSVIRGKIQFIMYMADGDRHNKSTALWVIRGRKGWMCSDWHPSQSRRLP